MSATPARIGFVMQAFRIAIDEDIDAAALHGSLARRDEEPVETFFDDVDDADLIANARIDLLSPERRRFGVTVKGMDEALALSVAGPANPEAVYRDTERGIEIDVLIAEVGFDFAGQKASLVVWG